MSICVPIPRPCAVAAAAKDAAIAALKEKINKSENKILRNYKENGTEKKSENRDNEKKIEKREKRMREEEGGEERQEGGGKHVKRPSA